MKSGFSENQNSLLHKIYFHIHEAMGESYRTENKLHTYYLY